MARIKKSVGKQYHVSVHNIGQRGRNNKNGVEITDAYNYYIILYNCRDYRLSGLWTVRILGCQDFGVGILDCQYYRYRDFVVNPIISYKNTWFIIYLFVTPFNQYFFLYSIYQVICCINMSLHAIQHHFILNDNTKSLITLKL